MEENNKPQDKNLIRFFNKDYTYAIVGASNNEKKYGYKIFKALKEAGINVIPINPKEKTIQNIKSYNSILEIKEHIDVVDFVVPAQVTMKTLEQIKEMDIKRVWFQPNTFNDECLKFCVKNKIYYMLDFCLLKAVLNQYK